ncbi:MAG: hypothetical protein COU08_04690 [Candidatus Harrisonbacteria bacterium CG10_big_fil_rev_8_21_14_0_10_42_17]|uniref:Uncharacterized protein n=1 Tax=Candidatus Harrisonbacteria bacterium CG10_big_fil_rev_8_21_14_0_10_42_17 TaxID=1974584 RepID=A0A2M6WH68_9BACT|nr:MAG: hypothetical protein COU08_04690 [Candidatus Harrisonbacteria bacterium CG10_big_fil_rev_8_21_14_0_10_42_17]
MRTNASDALVPRTHQNQHFLTFQKNGGGVKGGAAKKLKGNVGFASAASLLQKGSWIHRIIFASFTPAFSPSLATARGTSRLRVWW